MSVTSKRLSIAIILTKWVEVWLAY